MAEKPGTVDEYIELFPEAAQQRLRQLRELSWTHAPEAVEDLKWGNPAHSLGTILFVFSGYKNHANFVFTPSTREAFADEHAGYKTGKGSVQRPYPDAVPSKLLGRMIEYRIKECEVDGIGCM